MNTLHIAPGDSAGGSLLQALRDAGRDDEVLPFRDDLSCGPIDSDEPSARAAWWGQFYDEDESESEASFAKFWGRVAETDDRLVVWFARHSARELAFFLAWVDRVGERPYEILDVTGQRLPFRYRDGSTALSPPAQSVSIVPSDALRSLLGTERPITAQERDKGRTLWRHLQRENAPFRIVTETGLVSTSIDHFDPLLLAQATSKPQKVAYIVGSTMANNSDRYCQVGDVMLHARVVALVDDGQLLADGDPGSMSCQVWLPPSGGQPA